MPMELLNHLPRVMHDAVRGQNFIRNTTGLSGAGVWVSDDLVLKIASDDAVSRREIKMMDWLQGKLPVPKIVHTAVENGMSYLLMSRLSGVMCCDEQYMRRPEVLIRLLADGLRQLWQVDVKACPCRFGLDERLMLAEENVRLGRCETELVEPDTYGEGGFRDPEHLLRWLKDHRPAVDPVLSHGDFCLPNLFLQEDQVSGYLDLGFCAVADRYQDIALCYRSLVHNADGTYGPVYPNVQPDGLFAALNMTPDWEKIRYYRLLDELF